jgi:hypothetical protein
MAAFPTLAELDAAPTYASQFSGGPAYSLIFTVGGQQYNFVPKNIAENGGLTAGSNTYLLPYFTSIDNLKDFGSKAQQIDISSIGLTKYLSSQGLSDKGYLVPAGATTFDGVVNPIPTETFGGDLTGLRLINGQVSYGLSGGHGQRYATTTGEVHDPYIQKGSGLLADMGNAILDLGPIVPILANIYMPGLGSAIALGTAVGKGASPEDLAKAYVYSQIGNEVGSNVGIATDNSIAGSIAGNTASGVLAGQSVEDALQNAAVSTAGSAASGAVKGAVNAPSQSGGMPTAETPDIPDTPTTDYGVKPDYSLTPSSQASTEGANPKLDTPTTVPATDYTVKPDYSLTTTTPDVGLQPSGTPNINNMKGGQGATVPVQGGTATGIGVTPDNASPNLGDPNSIINNPDVIGQPVAPTDTSLNVPLPNIKLPTSKTGSTTASQTNAANQAASNQPSAVAQNNLLGLLALLEPSKPQTPVQTPVNDIKYFYDIMGEDILPPTPQQSQKPKFDYAEGGTIEDLIRMLRS